jgi:V/A-type H+-transporting ATPase subunit G/H
MQEIVTKVLEAEKEAQQRIQEARNKAGEIRAQADQEVQGKLEQAREQAGRRAQEIVEQARSQAQAEYDKTLQQSKEENELFFEQHEEKIDRAAEAVMQLITTPEWSS